MRTIIIGSGHGSNCRRLLECESADLLNSAKIVAVFSNNKSSGILKVAKDFGVHANYPGPYISALESESLLPHECDTNWINEVDKFKPALIVLAGFMRILSSSFIEHFNSRVINLHPSLLPSFPGKNAIENALESGVKVSGCTVHWVTADLDSGPIIDQSPVRIDDKETKESLASKIQKIEHDLLPRVVAGISTGVYKPPN